MVTIPTLREEFLCYLSGRQLHFYQNSFPLRRRFKKIMDTTDAINKSADRPQEFDVDANEGETFQNGDLHQKKEKWKSCCFDMDPRVVKFFTSVMFSMTLLIFCIRELTNPSLPQERFTLYISLITGIVNLWMPCPKIK